MRVRCPRLTCRSTEVIPVDTKKKFSIGKSIVGFAVGSMLHPVGGIVGAASGINGKNGKTTFYCQKCGHTFEVKL